MLETALHSHWVPSASKHSGETVHGCYSKEEPRLPQSTTTQSQTEAIAGAPDGLAVVCTN